MAGNTEAVDWLKENIARLNEYCDRKMAATDAKLFLHDVRERIKEQRRGPQA